MACREAIFAVVWGVLVSGETISYSLMEKRKEELMFETLDKMMLAGLGVISMTRERADKIFDEYVSRGKLEKENRTGFVKAVMDAADKNRAELEKLVEKQVRETMESLNLPTRDDLKRIEQKIDALSSRES